MRSFPRGLAAAAILVTAMLLTARGQQPAPTFRADTFVVPLYVTVTDAERRLVHDLLRDDFVVLEDGRPQEITVFYNEPQPVTVIVTLDTSASMTGNLTLLYAAAEQFLIRLLPDDRGMVGAFNDKIQFVGELTSDRDELVASLRDLQYGNATRLYDAIDASLDELLGVQGRRVVLVFTDGDDTGSRVNNRQVLARAQAREVMIYAIGFHSDYFNGVRQVRTRPDRNLRRLAAETGGGYFELQHGDELGPTFTRVAQELHSQYVLGFTPSVLDGRERKLSVQVRRPGLTARARTSYVASPQPVAN